MWIDSFCPFKDFISISTEAGAQMFITKLHLEITFWSILSFQES